jgi:NAD-dependent deacetylase
MDTSTARLQQQIDPLARRIAAGSRTVAFTGAGISTESGIPDYRSQGGLWERFRPVTFQAFTASREARVAYWQKRAAMQPALAAAAPNPAHRALAELAAMDRLSAVITQNIDGLHQAAGVPADRVIELHGNTRRIRCLTCRREADEAAVMARIADGDAAPECGCGGYLKPDTVSFGQSLPAADLDRAVALSRSSGVFLVVGSTLVVQPAALLPGYARQAGAFLAIVNLSETPYDDHCRLLIRERAGTVLPAVAAAVGALGAGGGSAGGTP